MPNYPYSFQLPPLNVQDIPNDGAVGEFLGISAGGALDWLPVSAGAGDMLKSENLSGLTSYPTARTNLGLGLTDTPTFKNLVISTGTITTSAPVTISQTWDAVAQTFKALVVNAAGTSDANSASGSLLADFQVNGVSKVTVRKDGAIVLPYGYAGIVDGSVNAGGTNYTWNGPRLGPFALIAWTATSPAGTPDTILLRDGAANTLALRNGAAAQTFNVYGTYTSGSVYERMFAKYDGTALAFQVGTQHLGATARPLQLLTDNTARMTIGTTGNVGIGTTAPAAKLDVAGGTVRIDAGTAQIFGSRTSVLTFYRSDLPTTYLNNITSSVSGVLNQSAISIDLANGASTTVSPFLVTADQTVGLGGNISNNDLSGASMVVKSGNVGIGTTAPGSKLEVMGSPAPASIGVEDIMVLSRFVNSGVSYGNVASFAVGRYDVTGQDAKTRLDLKLNNGASGSLASASAVMTLLGSGNVGIGTTAPSSKLQVSAGDVEVDTIAKGVILKSPDGTRYRVTVANGGTLSVAAV